MHEKRFWVVRSPSSGIEIPIYLETLAETFRREGWVVTPLPLAALAVWAAERVGPKGS